MDLSCRASDVLALCSDDPLYVATEDFYRRWRHWWLSPLTATPVLLIAMVSLLHTSYAEYIRGTHWLVALLGPATSAFFAIPIYEQRALIRRHWPVLVVGVVAGSTTAMLSAWVLAGMLGLGGALRLSLLPRSMSTPFAMAVSGDIGGVPELTAVFVVLTGIRRSSRRSHASPIADPLGAWAGRATRRQRPRGRNRQGI